MRRYLKLLLVGVCGSSLTLMNYACSPKSQKNDYASVSDEELNDLQKAELEALINEQIKKRDESGNIEELEGFTKTGKLDGGNENLLAVEDFRDLSQSDEQIFEFVPPDGVEAEFSEPVMISGASLELSNFLTG
ncbi:MAG: hypothetical protein AB8G05_19515 [Oligoflexales bacterium]